LFATADISTVAPIEQARNLIPLHDMQDNIHKDSDAQTAGFACFHFLNFMKAKVVNKNAERKSIHVTRRNFMLTRGTI
jgi:hypothetical protein